MPKLQSLELTVINTVSLTPNMKRVTIGGSDLDNFPHDQDSAYIKLLLDNDQADSDQPLMRTYTIRQQRPDANELDIDFVIHGDSSPASKWANHAKAGDKITIAGPGAKKLVDFSADWFVIAGDMTALPAISVNIEQLPESAKGYAVIEVLSLEDIQSLSKPDDFEIHWVINPKPGLEPAEGTDSPLLAKLKTMPWLSGRPSIWAASEFGNMRALRRYFKQERQVHKKELYVSSYWKKGISEEQHKVVKSKDAQQTA